MTDWSSKTTSLRAKALLFLGLTLAWPVEWFPWTSYHLGPNWGFLMLWVVVIAGGFSTLRSDGYVRRLYLKVYAVMALSIAAHLLFFCFSALALVGLGLAFALWLYQVILAMRFLILAYGRREP